MKTLLTEPLATILIFKMLYCVCARRWRNPNDLNKEKDKTLQLGIANTWVNIPLCYYCWHNFCCFGSLLVRCGAVILVPHRSSGELKLIHTLYLFIGKSVQCFFWYARDVMSGALMIAIVLLPNSRDYHLRKYRSTRRIDISFNIRSLTDVIFYFQGKWCFVQYGRICQGVQLSERKHLEPREALQTLVKRDHFGSHQVYM